MSAFRTRGAPGALPVGRSAAHMASVGVVVLLALVGAVVAVVLVRREESVRREWRDRLVGTAEERKAAILDYLEERTEDAEVFAAFPSIQEMAGAGERGGHAEGDEHVRKVFDAGRTRWGSRTLAFLGPDFSERFRSGDALDVRGLGPPPTHRSEGLVVRALHDEERRPDRLRRARRRDCRAGLRPAGSSWWTTPRRTSGRTCAASPSRPAPARSSSPGDRATSSSSSLLSGTARRASARSCCRWRRPTLAARDAVEGREGDGEYVDYRGKRVLAAVRYLRGPGWGLVVKVDVDEALAGLVRERVWGGATVLSVGARPRRPRPRDPGAGEAPGVGGKAADGREAPLRPPADPGRRRLDPTCGRPVRRGEPRGRGALGIQPERAPRDDRLRPPSSRGRRRRAGPAGEGALGRSAVPHPLPAPGRFGDPRRGLLACRRPRRRGAPRLRRPRRVGERGGARAGPPPEPDPPGDQRRGPGARRGAGSKRRPAPDVRGARRDRGIHSGLVRGAGRQRLPRPGGVRGAGRGLLRGGLDPARCRAGGAEPGGNRFAEGRTVVAEDWETDPRLGPYREAGRRRGYRSSAACPVRSGGAVRGVLSLYASEPGVFVPDAVLLLEELARDLGLALDLVEAEERRARAEASLAQSEERYRKLFEENPAPMWVFDVETLRFLDVNEAATRALRLLEGGAPRADAPRHPAAGGRSRAGSGRPGRADGHPEVGSLAPPPQGRPEAPRRDRHLRRRLRGPRRRGSPSRTTSRSASKTEEKIRAFFDSGMVGAIFGDVHGNVLAANDEFLRIVGYDREDLEHGGLQLGRHHAPRVASDRRRADRRGEGAGNLHALREGVRPEGRDARPRPRRLRPRRREAGGIGRVHPRPDGPKGGRGPPRGDDAPSRGGRHRVPCAHRDPRPRRRRHLVEPRRRGGVRLERRGRDRKVPARRPAEGWRRRSAPSSRRSSPGLPSRGARCARNGRTGASSTSSSRPRP